jgi:hypothetical protein
MGSRKYTVLLISRRAMIFPLASQMNSLLLVSQRFYSLRGPMEATKNNSSPNLAKLSPTPMILRASEALSEPVFAQLL